GVKRMAMGITGILFIFSTCTTIAQENDTTYFWKLYESGQAKCIASNFYQAKVELENALLELRQSTYQDYNLEARILTDIAWAYAGMRDNVTENIYIEAALQLYAENLPLESEDYAAALHDMALTQGERGNYEYAIELLDSSNVIFKKYVPEFTFAGQVSNLVSLGWMYRERGDYSKAIDALKNALDLVQKEGGDHYTDLGTVEHILGYTLMYNDNLEEAILHLLNGKRARRNFLGTTHPKYYQSHQKIAECYTYLEDYEKAQFHLDTIINALHSKSNMVQTAEVQLDSIKSWYTLLQTYVAKGNIYLYKYKEDQDINHLKGNILWFKKAIEAIQKILIYYPTKEGRFRLLKSYDFLFENCINQAVLLYEFYHDKSYLEEAFQISELSRGFTFLETLHKVRMTENYDVPKSLLQEEKNLLIKMQKFELGNEKDLQNSKEWIALNLELQRLKQKIKKEHPRFYDLKSSLIVPSITDIQQKIDYETAIVEFFKGNWRVYKFVITKDTATVQTMTIPENYNTVLTKLITQVAQNPIVHNFSLDSLKQNSWQIYQWLISPLDSLLHSKSKLVFIPHKKLNYLPFEILIDKDTTNTQPHYLIEDYSISYDYSCTSLIAERKDKGTINHPYFGLASGIRKEQLPDESIHEIHNAHQLLGGAYFTHSKANRINFFKGLREANVFHLAAHSILDTTDLSKFAIVLNDSKQKNQKDSILIEDIYLSEIGSRLIILSGCQTAYGVLKDGEGLLSLTNAFKYAGAASLTCSLWETENKVGSQIITEYISNLQQGKAKDKALRTTKLHFIQSVDPLLQHPFYWSTFVNVGNQIPITLPRRKTYKYGIIPILIFSLLLLILGLFYKNYKN
ncbi:MAG: CHAT domain-containing tetratricopeptide repeat protein, partial [Bacteroidota bacterium]